MQCSVRCGAVDRMSDTVKIRVEMAVPWGGDLADCWAGSDHAKLDLLRTAENPSQGPRNFRKITALDL